MEQLEHMFDNNGETVSNVTAISPPDDSVLVKLVAELKRYFTSISEDVDKMFYSLTQVREKVRNYVKEKFKIKLDWLKSLEDMKSEIESLVTMYRGTFEHLGIPVIIWDRSGVIYYVSPCFRQLLGFLQPLPTKREDFIFWKLLPPDGFKTYLNCAVQFLSSYPDNINENFLITNLSIKKNFNTPTESTVEGTISLTVKRDPFGLPFLILGCFLPLTNGTTSF